LYTRLTNLKRHNPNVKVFISIGGWAMNNPGPIFNPFSEMSASAENRQKFIQSLIGFISNFGFDGVDIDWKYPVASHRGGSPQDKKNYVQLLKDIKAGFIASGHPNFGTTFGGPHTDLYLQNYDLPAMLEIAECVST
ncbi:glycoside hydrolase family 18 protein, partial [Sphaerobolus stellatus SS14]